MRSGEPAHPGERPVAAAVPARRRHASRDERAPVRAVDRRVAGIEQRLHVEARRRPGEVEVLVRLVPDRPLADERVALRGGVGEVGERPRALRRRVRLAAAVRPRRRAVQRDERLDAALVQAVEHGVGSLPPVRGIVRRERARRLRRRDLIPVDAVADDRHAELLHDVEPVVERAGTVGEPRVVLDPVLHVRRRRGRRGVRACRDDCERHDEGEPPHPGEATRAPLRKTQGFR